MDPNPYAPPTVMELQPSRASALEELAWFAVGTRKLLVMSMLTFGLYTIHWFERHYRFQKKVRGESTMPLARGIFSIFFASDLFRRVEGAAAGARVGHGWRAGEMAGVFIACMVAGRILDRLSSKLVTGAASSILTLVSLALLFGMAYPIVRVQGTVNDVLGLTNPGHERNETFTLWNWLLLILGGGIVVLAVIGTFLPDE